MPSPAPNQEPLSLDELTDIALGRDHLSFTDLYLGLQGRVSRRMFWLRGVLALFIVATVAVGVLEAVGLSGEMAGGLVSLVLAWPFIAMSAKRWHDFDRSGWWTLIILVPTIGMIVNIAIDGFIRGTAGPNRYGADPLTARPHAVNTSR
jgi:uncharacterized membrane protein YhaH (DUF805 family)